jgi:hypothetical protein
MRGDMLEMQVFAHMRYVRYIRKLMLIMISNSSFENNREVDYAGLLPEKYEKNSHCEPEPRIPQTTEQNVLVNIWICKTLSSTLPEQTTSRLASMTSIIKHLTPSKLLKKWISLLIVLTTIPGVSAQYHLSMNELNQAAGAILSQISSQTLLLSIGTAFGGDQSFANDAKLAFGLLSIGVAGINGVHAASTAFASKSEHKTFMSDEECEDREGGLWRYGGLIARLLRLYATGIISIIVGNFTCPTVSFGWIVILLLTTFLIFFGEAYAPLGVVISDIGEIDDYWCRGREDGSIAWEWRYTLTPSGSFIIHNNSLQSKVIFGRKTPSVFTDWFEFELEKWAGTYMAAALSVATWLWWLISLQLLAPWTWAPVVLITASVSMLMLAEQCNTLDSGDLSYGYSKRVRTARVKLQELSFMYGASGIRGLMNDEENLWMTKMVAASLVANNELSSAKVKNRFVRSGTIPTLIGTRFADLYTLGARLSATLQHEKNRLEVTGNTWPHLRIVEWAIAWNIELGSHAVSCNLYQSELQGYHQSKFTPTQHLLRACTAMSHRSCEVVNRFRKETAAVWHGQLWKFAALAQICTITHPELASQAASCNPDNHAEAVRLWSEYLFGDQGWDPCIVLLTMVQCLCLEGAITYGAFDSLSHGADDLIGCKSEVSHETVLLWYGNRMVQLNRDIPTPFAAPPRFAKDGALLPITESAITAEKRILSYLRASAPKLLSMHATHALLDFSSNEESVWDESTDAESFFEGDQNS